MDMDISRVRFPTAMTLKLPQQTKDAFTEVLVVTMEEVVTMEMATILSTKAAIMAAVTMMEDITNMTSILEDHGLSDTTTLVMIGLIGIITMATSSTSNILNTLTRNTDTATVMAKMMSPQAQTKNTTLYQSTLTMEDGDSLVSDTAMDMATDMVTHMDTDMVLDIGQSATE